MAFLDNIKGIFGGMEKPPELDKTKQALEGLKEQVKAQKIDEVLPKLQSAFMVDLDELNVTDQAKRMEYWGQVEQLVRNELMKATPEYAALENFTNNPTNLPELQKIINDTNPGQAAKSWLEKLPGGTWLSGGIAALIVGWADDMKNKSDDKKDTWLGSQLRKFAGWLGIKEEKKEAQETPEQALAKALTEKFNSKGLKLEASTITQGITALAQEGIKDEGEKKDLTKLVDESLADNSNLMKLYGAIKGKETLLAKFIFKITDLRFMRNFSEDQIKVLVAAINRDEKSPYKLNQDQVLLGIRVFLDEALKKQGDNLDEVLAQFKSPPAVAANPATTRDQG